MDINIKILIFCFIILMCLGIKSLFYYRENLTNLATPTPTLNTIYGDLIKSDSTDKAGVITQQQTFVNNFFPNHAFDEPGITESTPLPTEIVADIPFDPVNDPGSSSLPKTPINPLLQNVTIQNNEPLTISDSLLKLYTNQINSSIIDYSGNTAIERKMNPNPQDTTAYTNTFRFDQKEKPISNMYIS